MTTEYKKHTAFTPSEEFKPLRDEHNRRQMRLWFRKLSRMYLDVTQFETPQEHQEKTSKLITFLLAPYDGNHFIEFNNSREEPFEHAPLDVKITMIKEFLF